MHKPRVVLLAIFVLVCGVKDGQGFTTGNETLLRAALFTNGSYDVSVRPNASTTVALTLVPTSLNSIDIKAQTMSLTGWWDMTWPDQRLTWTPSGYGDITDTHVFQDEVWTPTIVVYNSVNNLGAIDEDTIPLRIQSSGTLRWSPPGILTVSCNTDVRYFPFDSQICGVSVKTFGYTLRELELEAESNGVDLTYYEENGEWSLLGAWTQEAEYMNYSQVTFMFKFKRKPEFYGMNLIMPVVMMAILGLFIFVLPAESGEKMGYSLTVMLTFVVIMTILGDKMPSTAEHTSYFEVYVVLVLFMCGISVLLSIVSLYLYFHDENQKVPKKLRDITRFFLRAMCKVKDPSKNKTPREVTKVSAFSMTDVRDGPQDPVSGPEVASDEPEVTWKMMSTVLDAFFLRTYVALFVLTTLIFFAIVTSG